MFDPIQQKLLTKPFYLWDIRLNMMLALIEDQTLLLSLLTHLNYTFKIVCRKRYPVVSEQMVTFFAEFDSKFESNFSQFQTFLSQV
jgi:hypothetical protein